MRVFGALFAVSVVAACASTPEPPAPRDRTDDPEFAAARAAARPEFESQADALAAGVYETFSHPDSVRPAAAPVARPAAPEPVRSAGDPSTAELLGTLERSGRYDPPSSIGHEAGGAPRAAESQSAGEWTLQVGAYATETGALVRVGQIERDFPGQPRWVAAAGGLVRVYLGRFADRAAAERFRAEAAARGYGDTFPVHAP